MIDTRNSRPDPGRDMKAAGIKGRGTQLPAWPLLWAQCHLALSRSLGNPEEAKRMLTACRAGAQSHGDGNTGGLHICESLINPSP